MLSFLISLLILFIIFGIISYIVSLIPMPASVRLDRTPDRSCDFSRSP